jgi:uncharacterized protein (TIGR02147 family)
MINVFDYTDFRRYLSDYYEERKKENPGFSYKFIADKAGMSNKGFVYNIIKGEKALSKSNAFRISGALKHGRYEAEYFENLVSFNQAKNMKEKNLYFDRMCRIREKGKGACSQPAQLRKEQFEFFSKWYHTIIRSLIDMYEFRGDYRWLAKMVNPSILPRDAKKSVQLLEKLGLIEKQKSGLWKVTDKSVTTGKEVAGLAVENYHMEAAELAKRAIHETTADKRNISGLVLGISQEGYARIVEEIQEFQKKVMAIADSDEEADRVYHFNLHLYPVSRAGNERGRQ